MAFFHRDPLMARFSRLRRRCDFALRLLEARREGKHNLSIDRPPYRLQAQVSPKVPHG
jgi:hypothetical protein